MVSVAPKGPVSTFRRVGYRLLGARFNYLLHLRPAEWPIVAAHAFAGYLIAVGFHRFAQGKALPAAVAGILVWVVLLNGGTLALNSAFDHDTGDIGYLRNPPPAPKWLAEFGLALLLVGQVLAFWLPTKFTLAYFACLAMSLAYSVPPIRLKAKAGWDWVINMLGFGTLTAFAGYATAAHGLRPGHFLVLLGFGPLFAALYPLTQLYQFDEDRRRGDRTLALRLGMRRSLAVALAATALAFAFFVVAGIRVGWGIGSADLLRWVGIAVAAAAWLAVLLPWYRRHSTMRPPDHQRGMYQALWAWALTDLVLVLAWATFSPPPVRLP